MVTGLPRHLSKVVFGQVITINHHYYWAKPSVLRPTPWAKPSILTSPQHPYPWAHLSALATAVQLAHLSEIPTISNGPIIGWPVSHGTLSTSAVRYRWTKTLKGLYRSQFGLRYEVD